jgi:hypothetical protein
MTIRQLVLAASRTARTADTLGSRFAIALGEVLRDTERRLRPVIEAAAEGNPTAIVRAAQANRTRNQIRETLRLAGYDDLAAAFTSELDTMTERVLRAREIARLSAELTPRLEGRIEALKALYELDLLDEGDVVARRLWQATVRGVFGARPVSDILHDLGDVIDRTEPQIRTLYDTSVSIFGRQVEALQAGDEPDTPFAYMGPIDGVTRPFCRKHVGKVYTRAQIAELDNGQLNDVFLTGGGYNCRHVWQEVSKFSESFDLIGTGERLPEVVEELEMLGRAA